MLVLGAVVAAGRAVYEARWAASDRATDRLDLGRLGRSAHREHNDFFSVDVAPNTTVDLQPRAGKSVEDLRAAVARRMQQLGYASAPFAPNADYVQWQHSPPAGQDSGHGTLVIVSVPQVGSRVGSDTNGLHRITRPIVRLEVFAG